MRRTIETSSDHATFALIVLCGVKYATRPSCMSFPAHFGTLISTSTISNALQAAGRQGETGSGLGCVFFITPQSAYELFHSKPYRLPDNPLQSV
jgi:hypothetical protein